MRHLLRVFAYLFVAAVAVADVWTPPLDAGAQIFLTLVVAAALLMCLAELAEQ